MPFTIINFVMSCEWPHCLFQRETDHKRVPNKFYGIRDFPYVKLGILDFKANPGKIVDWKCARELECLK